MHSAGLKFSVTRNHYSPITLAMDEHHVAPALSIQMKPRALQGLCHNLQDNPDRCVTP